EFSFHADALGVRFIDNSLRDRDVFFERLLARIDHDRAVKTRRDAIIARLFIAMIEMDGENSFGKHSLGGANYRLEHAFVGIFPGALRKLNDERRATLDIAAEQAEALFHVVDVVRADRKFAVGDFVKLSGGDDHMAEFKDFRFGAGNLNPKSENLKCEITQCPFGLAGNITLTSVPCGVESISTRPL